MNKIIAMLLVLAMALSLCACGAKEEAAPATEAPVVTEAPVETEAPETEAVVEEEGGYTVTVLDENGAPLAGVLVQLCKDACVPAATDAEGVARFNLPEDTYKVSFLALPAGFTYMDEAVQEFYFENGSTDMTITLKAAE